VTIKLQLILIALVSMVVVAILAIDWRNQSLEKKRAAANAEFSAGSYQRPKRGKYQF
jgi:Tfp pilus assembly protein PilX